MNKGQRYELFGITREAVHESICFGNKDPKKVMDAFKGWPRYASFYIVDRHLNGMIGKWQGGESMSPNEMIQALIEERELNRGRNK